MRRQRQPSDEWWTSITHAFRAHVRDEAAFIESYRDLVEGISDPGTKFLVETILEEERRHHELFERMADAALAQVPPEDPTLPRPPQLNPDEAAALREPTERFLEAEQEDREELQRLAKELKPVRDDTLWRLLVELMEMDTRKHIRILEYLDRRIRAAS